MAATSVVYPDGRLDIRAGSRRGVAELRIDACCG